MGRARTHLPPDFVTAARHFEREWWRNTDARPEEFLTPGTDRRRSDALLDLLQRVRHRLARHLEDVTLRFVQAWRRGERPRIEDYLAAACREGQDEKRCRLFRELLIRELQLSRFEDDPAVEAYRARFPDDDFQGEITEAFEEVNQAFAWRFRVLTDTDGDEIVLGGGGQAVVLLGYDQQLEREVAIKRVTGGEVAATRLRREARTLARLEDAGVPAVYGVGRTDDQRCLAELLIRGPADEDHPDEITPAERLTDRIAAFRAAGGDARRRNPEFLDLVAKMINVCRTVSAAHRHRFRILHRDLKPDNILLDATGRPFVIDWGLAAWMNRTGVAQACREPVVGEMSSPSLGGGTPGYMSPEQALAPRQAYPWVPRLLRRLFRVEGRTVQPPPLTPACDVFGLGACLFRVVTGVRVYDCAAARRPFRRTRLRPVDGAGVEAVAELISRALRYRAAPNPRALTRRADPELCDIVRRAIAPTPGARYQDAGELAEALEDWLRDNPPRHPAGGWLHRRRYGVGRWVRRNTGKFVLVTLLATVSLAVAGAWWTVRERTRRADETAQVERKAAEKKARDEAAQEFAAVRKRDRAEAAYRRLTDHLDAARRAPGPVTRARRDVLLEEARDRLDEFVKAAGDSHALQPGDFLCHIATAHLAVAYLHHRAGALARAEAILSAGLAATPDPHDRSRPDRAVTAEMYAKLGEVRLDAGKPAEAIRAFEEAAVRWAALRGGTHALRPVAEWHDRTLAQLAHARGKTGENAGPGEPLGLTAKAFVRADLADVLLQFIEVGQRLPKPDPGAAGQQ